MSGAQAEGRAGASGGRSVRPCRVDLARGTDVDGILALRAQLVDWLATRRIDQWRHSDTSIDSVSAQVAAGEWHVVRANDDTLAGAFRLLRADPEFWGEDTTPAVYVHGLMVERALGGQGVGASVLEWVADRARAQDAEVIRLDCGESNQALREYYRCRGFDDVGRRDFDHGLYSVTLFERRLS